MGLLSRSLYNENEIIVNTDLNYSGEAALVNAETLIKRLLGTVQYNVIVDGFEVQPLSAPSLNVQITRGMAINVTTEKVLYSDSLYGPLPFDAPHPSYDRIDLIQMRRTSMFYDSQIRAFKNPTTGEITYAPMYTKEKYIVEFQVKQGTPSSSPVAPTVDVGWIKLAEVKIRASTSQIVESDIFNCTGQLDGEETANWTVEKNVTFRLGTLKENRALFREEHTATGDHIASLIAIVDSGDELVATNVEDALQELSIRSPAPEVLQASATLEVNKRYIVDAWLYHGAISLYLPSNPTPGDTILITCCTHAVITQTDAEHIVSWKNTLFTTKGTSGKVRLYPGDVVLLSYRGAGVAPQAPTKIANPATLPGSDSRSVSWRYDGRYLAVPHASTPYITIYDWNSGSPVKIPDPAVLPTGDAVGSAWSPDGRYLAIAHANSPYITIYDWNSGSPVKITNPATLPTGAGQCVAWSSDGRYLAVGHYNSPYITIYDWNSGSPVKIPDPAVLPTGAGIGVVWSPDGRYLAIAHANSPYITIYDWISGSPVKLSNPATLPAGDSYGIAWSPDGRYLVVGHTSSPYVTIYDWISGSPVKINNPSVLPVGIGVNVAWSPEGRYLAVAHVNSPYITIYDWIWNRITKIDNPTILPSGNGYGIAWSPDGRYLVVGHTSSPYVTIYNMRTSANKEWVIDIRAQGGLERIGFRSALGTRFF